MHSLGRGYALKVVAAVVASLAGLAFLATTALPGDGSSTWRPGQPPARSEWTRLPPSPLSARHDPVAAFVGTSLLIAGGSSDPPCPANASCALSKRPTLRDGAVFDSATGAWHRIADAPTSVAGFNTALVGDRLFMLTAIDGRSDAPAAFLSYDIGSDRWATLPRPPDTGATLVAAGDTVVAIARTDRHARAVDAAFDAASQTWRPLPDDPLGPSASREALWVGDRLVLSSDPPSASATSQMPVVHRIAILDRTLRHWSTPLPDSDVVGSGPLVASGRVVWPETGSSDGGGDWDRPYPLGGILDPSTGSWQPIPANVPNTVGLMGCEMAVADRVCVDGHLLDPITLGWTRLSALPGGQRSGSATVTGPDTLWIWGGWPEDGSAQPANQATGFVFRA